MIQPLRLLLTVTAFALLAVACDAGEPEPDCSPPLHPFTECLGDCVAGSEIDVDEQGCSTCYCQSISDEAHTCQPPLYPFSECLGDCAAGFQIEVDAAGCSTCYCQPI